jgi:carboxymethylenebutenolidase
MLQETPNQSNPTRLVGLSNGFAAAVQPVASTTITTDDAGLFTSTISIQTSNGEIPGYIARPESGSNFPIIVVVHEVFGVHEHIKDVCRRFAKVGYLAIAPELFSRVGDVSAISEISELIKVVAKAPDSLVLSDIKFAVRYAIEQGSGDPDRQGIIGFCWGGRISWLYAAQSDNLKAGVAFYGRLVGQNSPLQPSFPVDAAQVLNAPVLGLYGGKDESIPQDTVETMRALLEAVDSPSKITVYPNAGHAFFADYRPSYNAEAAADAWNQTLAFLKEHGV